MSLSQTLSTLAGDSGSFTMQVDETWAQGRAVFGGLVAAAGNEAMRQLVPGDRLLRSLQTTFVGPATPGTWRLEVRVLRVGKAVTVARCDVIDSEQVAATIVGVYGMARASAVHVRPVPRVAARKVDEINEVRYRPDVGMPAFMQHFAVRWAEGRIPFTAAPNEPTKAFIRYRDDSRLTESSVVGLIDCIPTPATSMFKAPAPASSLVWSVEFFEHRYTFPPDAWWRIDTEVEAAGDGYVHQTGVLNDPNGIPAALSRQVFAVFG